MPSGFMVFGVWLSAIHFTTRSETRLYEPSLLPLKQKIMINRNFYNDQKGTFGFESDSSFSRVPDYEDYLGGGRRNL